MAKGTLAILGSGETAPGMTKVHRELLKRHAGDLRAVTIDTAYGFQENVPQMTEKLVNYFDTSLHVNFTPLHFTSYEKSSEIDRAVFKQQVREANYVFAGPGSPSYAIDQWLPLHLSDDFNTVLESGGTRVSTATAAAATRHQIRHRPYCSGGRTTAAPLVIASVAAGRNPRGGGRRASRGGWRTSVPGWRPHLRSQVHPSRVR